MSISLNPLRIVRSLNRRLGRIRVLGFVPANAILIALLATATILSANEAVDSFRSTVEPRHMTLDAIFSAKSLPNRHVEVTGMVFPEAALARRMPRRGMEGPVLYVHVAMIPDDGSKILFVKFPGDLAHGEPRLVTVAGLLCPPEAQLARTLAAKNWRFADVPVEKRFVLVAGMTPAPKWLYSSFAIVTGLLTVGLLVTLRRGGDEVATTPANPEESTHV